MMRSLLFQAITGRLESRECDRFKVLRVPHIFVVERWSIIDDAVISQMFQSEICIFNEREHPLFAALMGTSAITMLMNEAARCCTTKLRVSSLPLNDAFSNGFNGMIQIFYFLFILSMARSIVEY